MLEWNNTIKVLNDFGKILVERYRENLQEHRASGKLQDTCRYFVETGTNSIELNLSLEEYWKYIEYGTKPHWAPITAIRNWIEIKPVLPYPGKDGKLPTPEQLAFLISRKISIEGTKPTNILEGTIDEVLAEFDNALDEAITQDLDTELSAIMTIIH